MSEEKEQEIEEDFVEAFFGFELIKCPECRQRFLLSMFVGGPLGEKRAKQLRIRIQKIPQGNCRDCVHFKTPESMGEIGDKAAFLCGKDDLAALDEKKYPQHEWSIEEYRKGVNKHTWQSIETLSKAEIKDLKSIEFTKKKKIQ